MSRRRARRAFENDTCHGRSENVNPRLMLPDAAATLPLYYYMYTAANPFSCLYYSATLSNVGISIHLAIYNDTIQ